MIEFIFMLTRDDVTLSDARAVYASIAGQRPPPRRLQGRRAAAATSSRRFMDEIRANGHTSYLEVVSETEEATLALGPRWPPRSAPTT